jgi:hypothetical protein
MPSQRLYCIILIIQTIYGTLAIVVWVPSYPPQNIGEGFSTKLVTGNDTGGVYF